MNATTFFQQARENQMLRFVAFGTLNTGADYAVLNALYLYGHVSLFWSVFWGFLVGSLFGYFLHSRYTFRFNTENREFSKLTHFLIVYIANLGLTELWIYLLTTDWGWHYNFAKLVSTVITITVSYNANKFWIFR